MVVVVYFESGAESKYMKVMLLQHIIYSDGTLCIALPVIMFIRSNILPRCGDLQSGLLIVVADGSDGCRFQSGRCSISVLASP